MSTEARHAELRERLKLIALGSGAFLLFSGAVLVLVLFLAHLYLVTMPVAIALLLGTVFAPLAGWLRARRVPRTAAALIVVLGALAAVGGLVRAFGPAVTQQVRDAVERAERGFSELGDFAARALPLSRSQVDALISRGKSEASENPEVIGRGLKSGALTVVEIAVGFVLSVVLLFFFVRDGDRMFRWFVERAPPRWRGELEAGGRTAWRTLAGYLRGTAIVALVDAIGIGVGLLVIGVPLVLPLAMITFLAGFVPIVGAVTAGILAVLVALASEGAVAALWTLGVVVAVQQVETNVLQPVVLGRVIPLHPAAILVVVTAGSILGGVLGAFLSVPAVAVFVATVGELTARRRAAVIRRT